MFTQLLQLTGLAQKWPTITREEVASHNTSASLWIIVDNSVLDITSLIGRHPGGNDALLKRGGGVKDCARDLMFHGRAARRSAQRYKIGELPPCDVEKPAPSLSTALPQAVPPLQTSPETRTKVFVPTKLLESHRYGSDSEQSDDDANDRLLSSSDADIVIALNVNKA
ncbi:putative Cytochrome b5-like Heme/Steroid binding domain containing protein [Leishmania naiffi]|uniref:Cytochrome b5-like Heme/Steroid binding domain containing protein n=1 Tax=Leishmania naiffi TaxID=5678 RepID=A0AAW3BJH3_9TRYP